MPSGTRPALPKPKKAGRERGNSLEHFVKGDISIEDQLKYRRHLLTANQNFVGFNKENLDIIAISFEHLCFSQAENKKEYKAKIRAKLREWGYEDFSEDDEVYEVAQNTGHNSETMQTPTITAITGENLSFVSNNSTPGSFVLRTPPETFSSRNPTPHSNCSTASKGSSKLGRSSSARPRLPSPPQQLFSHGSSSYATLFDPSTLEKINLNDPASRAAWVEAVWNYFNSGGRPPSSQSNSGTNSGRLRSSSFASMPSSANPTTPMISHFQPLTVPNQHQGEGYEAMEGLETYYQEGHQQDNIGNLGQMVDLGTLSSGTLSFVHEQWRNMQDQDIGNA